MVDRVSAFLLYLVVVVAVCVGSSGWSRNQTISEDSTRSHDDFGFWITLISPTQRLLAQRTCTTLAPHNDDRGVFFSFFSLLMITYSVPTNKNNNYDDRYRSWHNLLDYYLLSLFHSCSFRRALPGSVPSHSWPCREGPPRLQDWQVQHPWHHLGRWFNPYPRYRQTRSRLLQQQRA